MDLIEYLVSKDSKGKIRTAVVSCEWDKDIKAYIIRRETSQFGGKITKHPIIIVERGKVNRTVTEQSTLEFNSKVSNYLDKGYKKLTKSLDHYTKEDLLALLPEETTDSAGNLKPMLAKDYNKVATSNIEKILWYSSFKLDGVRMLMFYKDGEIHTSSRGGKNYDNSTYHITTNDELKAFFKEHPDMILDGELYVHGHSLQELSGLARLKKETDRCDILQYHVYDIVDTNLTFEERMPILEEIKTKLNLPDYDPNISYENYTLQMQIVEHVPVKGWVNIKSLHDKSVAKGFEGIVLRDPSQPYGINKRDKRMIKIKDYKEDEFEIIGYSDGLRPEDMVFKCKCGKKSFEAKPIGPRELKHEYLERMDEIIGKKATVKYFNFSADGIPTQPVLKCIRDYE